MLILALIHHELPPWRFLGSIGLKMGEIFTGIEFLERNPHQNERYLPRKQAAHS